METISMKSLRIQRKKMRNISICKKCEQFEMAQYSKSDNLHCKCQIDGGYAYEYTYYPFISEGKYVRYELNDFCPYILEHLLIKNID